MLQRLGRVLWGRREAEDQPGTAGVRVPGCPRPLSSTSNVLVCASSPRRSLYPDVLGKVARGAAALVRLGGSFPWSITLCRVGGENNPTPQAVFSNLIFFLIQAKPLCDAWVGAAGQVTPGGGDTGTSGRGFPALGKCGLAFPGCIDCCWQENCCWQRMKWQF